MAEFMTGIRETLDIAEHNRRMLWILSFGKKAIVEWYSELESEARKSRDSGEIDGCCLRVWYDSSGNHWQIPTAGRKEDEQCQPALARFTITTSDYQGNQWFCSKVPQCGNGIFHSKCINAHSAINAWHSLMNGCRFDSRLQVYLYSINGPSGHYGMVTMALESKWPCTQGRGMGQALGTRLS